MTDQTPLPTVDENWTTALAVVAHPDDMEFGTAAAVARWTRQGKTVIYCMVTSGEAGIDAIAPEESGPLREKEQIASARAVGVDQVEFLRLPDGVLEYGVPLRRVITEQVRTHRPEIVITGNHHPTFPGGVLNQADHIATGRATIDAVRDAGNRWIFNDQLADGLEPWNGVRQVWVTGSPEPTHGVDVTATFDDGVASLKEHAAYIEGLSWEFDPEAFLTEICSSAGPSLGVPYATTVEVIDLG
ncbi:PIG-L deacetylase family protein [Ruania halotolerans]|uniref:PIG-L deacetylase family protein n=1 Tax=Ruania halotolerans TaxID=2897773 RepID=UPI001E4723FE|nr:PIG-L deacetylase family protein [Ruania halotolerans]UFU08172.1 PIG-L family deacetylase [Ruania halotolerans]